LEELLRGCQAEVDLPFDINVIISQLVLSGVLDSITARLTEKSSNTG
jgi:hypothetical protein